MPFNLPVSRPSSIVAADYQIARSLRYNGGESPYLSRTYVANGNSDVWTFHIWLKRGKLSGQQWILEANSNSTNRTFIYIDAPGNIAIATILAGATVLSKISTPVFRDPSAWFALTIGVNTSTNSYRFWIGEREITTWSANVVPAAGTDTFVMSAVPHVLGMPGAGGNVFDGYMANVHLIDGQALDYSAFLAQDPVTGVWMPKQYTGGFGTNGCWLKFSDNATVAALGTDYSGNGHHWNPVSFNVVAGAANDCMVDTPTNYGTPGANGGGEVRGNYATLDPLLGAGGMALWDGNLLYAHSAAVNIFELARANQAIQVKTYWETFVPATATNYWCGLVDIKNYAVIGAGAAIGYDQAAYPGSVGYVTSGGLYQGTSPMATYATAAAADTIMHAYDPVTGGYWIGKNGTWFDKAGGAVSDPGTGADPLVTLNSTLFFAPAITDYTANQAAYVNFGQRPFTYPAPTGFKALCTGNLPDPAVKRGDDYFGINLREATGAPFSVTSSRFQPDLVWIKARQHAPSNNTIYDSARNAAVELFPNLNVAEVIEVQGLQAFTATGFSVGTKTASLNFTAGYVDWMWKKGVVPGVEIAIFTAGAAGTTAVAHSLGVAPKMVVVKQRNGVSGWWLWHYWLETAANSYLSLNTINPITNFATMWGASGHNATHLNFSVGGSVVASSPNVAIAFAEVPGFSRFGNYVGNGNVDGTFCWCGFRPRWVLFKRVSGTDGTPLGASNWLIFDAARNTFNPTDLAQYPNLQDAEAASAAPIDITANGFKLRNASSGFNKASDVVIYAAFAEHPFKYARAR